MKRRPVTDAPERLSPDQRERVRQWARAHEPSVEPHLGRHWAMCRDWHLSNGILRSDWEATMRSWLRKAVEFESARGDTAIRRGGRGEAAPVAQVLRLLQGGEK